MYLILHFCQRYLRQVVLLVVLFVTVPGKAQTFSLSFQRAGLRTVFSKIEQESPFRFLYTEEMLAQSQPVSFTVREVSLDSVLSLCFREQPLSYVREGQHIIIRPKVIEKPLSVNRTLRGKIVDEQGEPMAGITVAIQPGKGITATDQLGEFIFSSAPASVQLSISGGEIVGQELFIGNQPYVVVTVQRKVTLLDESVVIAYGKTTKRNTTGTISKVGKDELGVQPITNFLAGIEGRVTGLQIAQSSGLPGSHFSIRLRGQNSIANGNEPLYIIDGVPLPSNSLTSTLGGGGGANASPLASINPSDIESVEILKDADATAIYGSRGANGVILISTRRAKAGQTSLDAKIYSGWGKVTRLLPMLGLDDYLTMRKEAFSNDGVVPTISNARDLKLWDSTRFTDWQKLLIGQSMHLTDVNLGLSGGSGQTQFFINGGYHKESTIIPGDFGEDKKSLSFSLHHLSVDRRFRVTLSGTYMHNKTFLPKEDISTYLSLAPNAPALYTAAGKFNWENSTWTNPLAILERSYETRTANLLSNLHLSYTILKGLEAKVNVGFTSMHMREHVRLPGISYDPGLPWIASAGFGSNLVETFISEPQLSYKFSKGKANLQVLAGGTLQGTAQQALVQSGSGYQSDELLHSLQAASTVLTITDQQSIYRYAGFFSRLSVDWDSRYFLTLNGRRDGSSRYGPAQRFANFGSAGLGWIFSREKLLQSSRFLSYGKLKFSMGVTGNDQIGDYKFLHTYGTYLYNYQNVATLTPTQLFNPSYSWEKVVKNEVSLDLGFLKDRFLLTVNYYHNLTRNQLIQYALPGTTGFQGILQNLPARIKNYGWEFELNSILLKQKNWSWNSKFTLTIPRNRLVSFEGLASSSYANTYVIGQPLSISKRFLYTGVDKATGNYSFADQNGDGRISSPADLAAIVFTGQQYFGGLDQTLRYKNFKLGIFTQFVRILHTPTYISRFARPGSLSNQPSYVTNRWRSSGQTATIQKYSNSNNLSNTAFTNFRNSDQALGNGSYIRVKNISGSYELPAKVCAKAKIKSCSFFIQLQNPFSITSYQGLDPETKAVIPPLKLFTGGLQLSI